MESSADRKQLALEQADLLSNTVGDSDVRSQQSQAARDREHDATVFALAHFDGGRKQALVDQKAEQLHQDPDVLASDPHLCAGRRIVDIERVHQFEKPDALFDEERLQIEHHTPSFTSPGDVAAVV